MLGDNLITTSVSFLLQTLVYLVEKSMILHLLYCTESFYLFKKLKISVELHLQNFYGAL